MSGNDLIRSKFSFFDSFWKGEGPSAVLFAEPHLARGKPYLRYDLVEQHREVEKQLEERLLEVEGHLDLVDDGIPTVRSDLGTTLIPSGLGLRIEVQPELHPWLAEHLSAEQYLALPSPAGGGQRFGGEVLFAERFYRLFLERRRRGGVPAAVYPYLPDTQGIFDLSHLVVGPDLLYLLSDCPELALAVQERSLGLFLAATRLFKELLGEAETSMVHGHGMPIGAWFPDTGARVSEDSATLISEPMIRRFCLPFIRRAAKPFGRLFMHFCGHHPAFLRLLCSAPEISTVNLGNPEMYDLEEVFSLCGSSGTAYLGHLPLAEDEDGPSYLERVAELAMRNGARVILVSAYHPGSREEKAALVDQWHRLTRPRRIPAAPSAPAERHRAGRGS